MNPKVSIIMATYNRAHFIVETLLSVQNQTFLNWECLIIDDGGSDNTFEVISPLLAKDLRFTFLKRPDNYAKGLPGCRNFGLDSAKGEFIIFFDDDDIVHPQNLEICTQELEAPNIFFCRYVREVFEGDFDNNFDFSKAYTSFEISKSLIGEVLFHKIPFNSCAVIWRRECFEKNRFIETLMYAEEWELYSRILSQDFKGISIEKCLFFGRKHPESNTGEFYRNNSIRRASKAAAILLVIENLQDKNLLSKPILRYFISMSSGFKEFDLFSKILHLLKAKTAQKIKWKIFYYTLPLRMPLYKIKKSITKN